MRCMKSAALFGALGLLAGCSITYHAAGKYTDDSEKFVGVVNASLMGGATLKMTSARSTVECEGEAVPTVTAMSCSAQSGTVELKCTDGRKINGTWKATSCTTGLGGGTDNRGKPFEFVFGLSEAEAARFAQ